MSLDLDNMPYIPRGRTGESVTSILLRFTGSNFEQPTYILKKLGFGIRDLPAFVRKLSMGDYSVLSQCSDLSDWAQHPFILKKAQSRSHRDWLNPKKAKVCAQCAQDELLPALHDLTCIDTCTQHGLTLQTHCPHCESAISWSRPHLKYCGCAQPLDGRQVASQTNITFNKLIEAFVNAGDEGQLQLLLDAETLLRERYGLDSETREIINELFSGNTKPLALALSQFCKAHPTLPIQAVIAPAYPLLTSFGISQNDALLQVQSRMRRVKPRPLPNHFCLSRQDLRITLNCSPRCLDTLLRNHFGLADTNLRKATVSLSTVEVFFGAFQPAKSMASSTSSNSLKALAGLSGRSIADWVGDIVNGRYQVLNPMPAEGIGEIQINHTMTCDDDVPEDYMTHPQATLYTGLYSVALTAARQGCLLPATPQYHRNNRWLYKRSDIDQFLAGYRTSGQLAQELDIPERAVKVRLSSIGIAPVTGPTIDGNRIYCFRTCDIAGLTKSKLMDAANSSTSKHQSKPRASGCTLDNHFPTKDVSKRLSVSQNDLHRFIKPGLLIQTFPDNAISLNTRFFCKKSVEQTERYLHGLVDIDTLKAPTGLSRWQLVRRINALLKGQEPIIRWKMRQHISKDHAEQLVEHCKQVMNADSAARYLKCTSYDLNNWVRLGHLSLIDESNTNYVQGMRLFDVRDIRHFASSANQLIRQRKHKYK